MPNPIVAFGHKILNIDFVYDFYQDIVGGRKYRDRLVRSISTGPKVVLDLGCGTAASANQLTSQHKYFGIDVSEKYVLKAKKRRIACSTKEFLVEDINSLTWQEKFRDFAKKESSLTLALGVLHHLDDDQSLSLLNQLRVLNAPNSIFFSVDPTILKDSSPIARWFAQNDRGRFVRTPNELESLFQKSGFKTHIQLKKNQFRIPLDTIEIFAESC